MLSNEWQNVKRVLAIRLDNIGDIVMLSPALRNLRQALPEASITLMASPAGSQVVPLLPWVDDVIVWRPVWQDVSGSLPFDPGREMQLIQDLRSRQFDAAWIFTSFSQSPFPPAYVTYLAGIPIRVGQARDFGGQVLSHSNRAPEESGHQAERNLALLEANGFSINDRRLELVVPDTLQARAEAQLRAVGVEPLEPYIVLAPGASCTARRYDPQRFAQVASQLVNESSVPLVVVGSAREVETLTPILDVAKHDLRIASMVGKTGVPELAAIIRRSSLVLANNSASLHIAEAFNRPMVITYSGTEYLTQWQPRYATAHLLRRETTCSPCYQFRCPFNMECMDIAPEEVVEHAMDLLKAPTLPALRPTSKLLLTSDAELNA